MNSDVRSPGSLGQKRGVFPGNDISPPVGRRRSGSAGAKFTIVAFLIAAAASMAMTAEPPRVDLERRPDVVGEYGGTSREQAADTISTALALATFDSAWTRIRDTHYDTLMNGIDWHQVRERLRPRVARTTSVDTLRAVLGEMLRALGESHYTLIPSEAARGFIADSASGTGGDVIGDVGIEMRIVGDDVVATRVDSGAPAYNAGVRGGWRVLAVGQVNVRDGISLAHSAGAGRALREGLLRFVLRLQAATRGEAGTAVTMLVRTPSGDSTELRMTRRATPGQRVKYGNLPATMVRVESRRIRHEGDSSCSGYIRFNTWMAAASPLIDAALDSLRDCSGIALDLRGNTGGLASMVVGLAGHFLKDRDTLAVIRTRNGKLSYVANPRTSNARGERVEPFAGKVAVLVDPLSASTTEIFAAALQGMGRARIFGDTTAGQALPATLYRLPSDDVLMLAVGDLRGAKGNRLEGIGVVPDVVVIPALTDLLVARDPALESALEWFRHQSHAPERRSSR